MKRNYLKQTALALCSATLVCATLPGCGGSSVSAFDKVAIGESIAIELAPNVNLELVKLPDGSLFGKYEVTQAQWETVMGYNPSKFKNPNNPVDSVQWEDSIVFLRRLNNFSVVKNEGLMLRLPTDSEWVSACRAQTAGDYCRLADGTEITWETKGEVAWFSENSEPQTHPVGLKKPNAFGLYDMLGNIWEWTVKEDRKSMSVVRGGGFSSTSDNIKASSYEDMNDPFHQVRAGLRVCATKEDSSAFRTAENGKEKIWEQARNKAISMLLSNMIPIPGDCYKYRMGKFEVTQAQWEAVMGDNPSVFEGVDNPVENISWNDCQEFLKKLNSLPDVKKSGLEFRLPTADEWDFACHAGSTGDYCKLSDGTEITMETLGQVAWKEDNSDDTTHPIGKKKPNAFGLHDVFGNVQEWTSTAEDGSRGFWSDPRASRGGAWCSFHLFHDSYGTDFRDNGTGFRLCAESEDERLARERLGDTHRYRVIWRMINNMVRIPERNFRIGKYEVTQAEWEEVMGEKPSWGHRMSRRFEDADNPVAGVSWDDCQTFLKKLNDLPAVKESGLTFRLPTEEEWEYACRAGATDDYCRLADGTEITAETLGQVAWFADNSDDTIHPVGRKKPNAFGLYDMHGNVWEWTDTADGEFRILRGGFWRHADGGCKSSFRRGFKPFMRSLGPGFRLCASGKADQVPASRPVASGARDNEASRTVRGGEASTSVASPTAIAAICSNMVQIPGKDYQMGKYEVTQAQWETVMGENPSKSKGSDNPVESVSWNECQKFLKKLNALPDVKQSGLLFRLPTEAEWEFACRAGSTGDYCKLADGKDVEDEDLWKPETALGEVAWYKKNSDGKTHPVGLKTPNAFGLYDMHGNVWEWTSTKRNDAFGQCGGALNSSARRCAVSERSVKNPDECFANVGFRLCAVLKKSSPKAKAVAGDGVE